MLLVAHTLGSLLFAVMYVVKWSTIELRLTIVLTSLALSWLCGCMVTISMIITDATISTPLFFFANSNNRWADAFQ